MNIGDRVRVKDDATMWGEPGAAPSTYRKMIGTVVGLNDPWPIRVAFNDVDKYGTGFNEEELEILPK